MILVFRSLDFPLLVGLLILATVVLLVFVALRWVILPRLARKPSRYARTARTDEWLSPQAPAVALALIEESLREHDPKVRTQIDEPVGEPRTSFGSDAVFRFKGSGSRKGWAALPLAATFRVAPDRAGSRVIGEIRDDFGWSGVEPPQFVATEVKHRAATVLRRAREVTTEMETTAGTGASTETPDPPPLRTESLG